MTLHIQDPESPNALSLHEAILANCHGAISGGGAFAFVTREGGELLLRDESFAPLATNGTFELIVGVDEITNVRALEALQEISDEFAGITIRVFHHNSGGRIFHPKFCWFRYETGGSLITGSGNLTSRGLRSNWEAFTITPLSPQEIDDIEAIWTGWTTLHNDILYAPDNADILERAARNIRIPTPGRRRRAGTRRGTVTRDPNIDTFDPPQQNNDVLIAEIPRASTRWNQANFDMDNFQNFFGMTIGNTQLIALLQHVNANGTLDPMERRPGVAVLSQNYRLELHAAAGLDYPTTGRPIGVFVRLSARNFRYRLLMPTTPHYATISSFLNSNWTEREAQILSD